MAEWVSMCRIVCNFDDELVIDLMTGSETAALELAVVGCKALSTSLRDSHDLDDIGCSITALQEFLTELTAKLNRMRDKHMLPFNPTPLLRRLVEANHRLDGIQLR